MEETTYTFCAVDHQCSCISRAREEERKRIREGVEDMNGWISTLAGERHFKVSDILSLLSNEKGEDKYGDKSDSE